MSNENLKKPTDKLGVLIVGLNGAVSTTFLAGTLAARKGLAKPIGSLTQIGRIRIGKRSDNHFPLIKDFIPIADLNDLVFGGWDARYSNCFDAAMEAKVLTKDDLQMVKDELHLLEPMKAVFEQQYVKNLKADWIKTGENKYDLYMQLRQDIRSFKEKNNLKRVVVIWCASTEVFIAPNGVHENIEDFEKGMKHNHKDISPSMLYAYAALSENVPYINGSPSLSADTNVIINYAKEHNIPIAGKDLKTGQTLIKTVIGPMLKQKALGLEGWFSCNILGNRDGEVLDDPDSFKTKEESKLSVFDGILQPELYPDLYNSICHKVRINYYPPRGDNKEGWDNIDIFGWMGYPMQLKINFLCRDSILAAPLVLDLVLLMDFSQRVGFGGVQDWLSFYFKSPMHEQGVTPEHDLFIQNMKFKNTMRRIMKEDVVTHI